MMWHKKYLRSIGICALTIDSELLNCKREASLVEAEGSMQP